MREINEFYGNHDMVIDMKKIGLLTFHNAHNFGAVLQCYSLYKELQKYGECKVVNYNRMNRTYTVIRKNDGIVRLLISCLAYFPRKGRFEKFNQFIDEFDKTVSFDQNTIEKLDEKIDAYVVGSDQIWNCTNKYEPIFFLENIKSENKISYAASFGKSIIPENRVDDVKKNLMDFNAISVREKSAQKLISDLYSINSKVVLDPVFLNNADFWRKETKALQNMPEKYILVYLIQHSNKATTAIKKLKKQTGLKVICVTDNTQMNYKLMNEKTVINVGPREFLWLFDNASYVVTSSFHGTAFSIIFQKKFFSVPDTRTPERSVDLLNEFGLSNRIPDDNTDLLADINYKKVEQIMKIKVKDSLEFLKNAIQKD